MPLTAYTDLSFWGFPSLDYLIILRTSGEPLCCWYGKSLESYSRRKWSNLGQLKWKKKDLRISLLSITRKSKLFLQYLINKFNIYFSIVLGLLKKTEILLSNSVVTFFVFYNIFFHTWLAFVYDLQKGFHHVHHNIDASFSFLLQKNFEIFYEPFFFVLCLFLL